MGLGDCGRCSFLVFSFPIIPYGYTPFYSNSVVGVALGVYPKLESSLWTNVEGTWTVSLPILASLPVEFNWLFMALPLLG